MLDSKTMDSNDVVAVYILTHNRPETVMRALHSVQKQTFSKIKIPKIRKQSQWQSQLQ